MLDKPMLKVKDAPDLSSYDWADPFMLEDQLTEDERLTRDSARAFAQEKLQPVSYTHLTLPTTPYV